MRTVAAVFAALTFPLTLIGGVGAASARPAAAVDADAAATAVSDIPNYVDNGQKDPRVAARAAVVEAKMLNPAVVAEAQRMLDKGVFTVTTKDADSRHLSVGGCGFLRLCVYFNRTEQRYIAAGASAAIAAAICIAGTPAACVVASTLVAIASVYISDRGGICSGRLRVQVLPYPGRPRCV